MRGHGASATAAAHARPPAEPPAPEVGTIVPAWHHKRPRVRMMIGCRRRGETPDRDTILSGYSVQDASSRQDHEGSPDEAADQNQRRRDRGAGRQRLRVPSDAALYRPTGPVLHA